MTVVVDITVKILGKRLPATKSVFLAANFFERIVGDSYSDPEIVPNIKKMRNFSVEGNSIGSKQRNNVPVGLIGMFITSYIVWRRKKKKTRKN